MSVTHPIAPPRTYSTIPTGLAFPYGVPGRISTIHNSNIIKIFVNLDGEEIPLESNSVDSVLVTYTLCTIPDAVAALQGMRRVLKPGGRLLYCEHGEAPDANVRGWQHRLNPGWRRVAGGCNMNRDIPGLIEKSGFRITSDERMYIPGLRILSYNYWGIAKP